MESNHQPASSEQINRIIAAAELTFGRAPKTPKDFDLLRLSVFERTATLLSATTLKRLWGYLGERVTPRPSTLDALCRYAGWPGFSAMLPSAPPSAESGPLALERIDGNDLKAAATITISWLPDRVMTVEYLGGNEFKIISALRTRLQAGDTFTAAIIANDQPLYLDRLSRDGSDLGVYVCGRQSGIRFILQAEKD